MSNDIRWKQRFQNFERAFLLLQEGLAEGDSLSELAKEGVIQRFEYSFELAWKTLKDYLHYGGIKDAHLPREIIKKAFSNAIIADGQTWIDMLEDRNLMSHTYDKNNFQKAFSNIQQKYANALGQVYSFLQSKLDS